jgi:hypothetical protein
MSNRARWPRPIVALCFSLVACGAEIDDGILEDEDHPHLNIPDEDGSRQIMAACPNGGKVDPKVQAFGKSIDGYASYDGQDTCSGSAKPGVVEFQKLVLATYPCTGSYGIVRGCGVGGQSEHKEGRAWDWKVQYPSQAASSLLNWLLATDEHGNKHAMARRFGVMYMVWNRKMWRAYRPGDGWQPYSGSNPHTDHVHFSFSWPGAKEQTTYFTAPPAPPPNLAPKGHLDSASCATVGGWAQDPNAKTQAVTVVVAFDGAPGAAGVKTVQAKADQHRADLCSAIGSCKHAFSAAVPGGLDDGQSHTVRAYALDLATKKHTELAGGPKKITCAKPAPPTPQPPPAPQPSPTPSPSPSPSPAPTPSPAPSPSPAPAPAPEPTTGPTGEPPPASPAPSSTSGDELVVGGCSVGRGPALEGAPGLIPLLLVALGAVARRTSRSSRHY